MLIDRSKTLYAKLPSKETAEAIFHLDQALAWLNQRTRNRLAQGVENTPLPHTTPEATGNKFRKKPVVIEAVQYNGSNNPFGACKVDADGKSYIETMHDGQTVILEVGDWVIPDGKPNTFYPCKPDIFEKTYDKVID